MAEELIRVCVDCLKILVYQSKQCYNVANKKETRCIKCGRAKGKLEEDKKINKFIKILRSKGLSYFYNKDQKIIDELQRKLNETNKTNSETDSDHSNDSTEKG
jgi:hypothetical protein